MIKPLLRTIPTLSGNVKLACTLLDYIKDPNNIDGCPVYNTYIRGAHIYPLSSQLFQKGIEAHLLNSSWEHDIKTFFNYYEDTFYDAVFQVQQTEVPLIDKTSTQYSRNTDFEYGVKRVSYSKSGNQFACFAPIYIDDYEDIPSYFLLKCTFKDGKQSTTKYIRINIASTETADNKYRDKNYICKYLVNYLRKIDSNVAYIDNVTKNVVYYGIDAVHGGFMTKVDSTISTLFSTKIPIQLFDYTISEGFKRNNMIMKQCLPLCFYFNVDDILTPREKPKYVLSDIEFSGNYYDKNGIKLDWYDFSCDYDTFSQDIIRMDLETGMMKPVSGFIPNIMDVSFPGLYDKWLTNYRFANKLSKTFNRWKLKYSSDEHPYITNMSWQFSKNQDNNYKYREFPSRYSNQSGYADVDINFNYNLLFPLGKDKTYYDRLNPRSAEKYEDIMNNYCLSWFDIVNTDNINESNIESLGINWSNTEDGYSYFNNVLYNFNTLYNKIPNGTKPIDKFAFLVYPKIDSANILNKTEYDTNVKFVKHVLSIDETSHLNTVPVYGNDSVSNNYDRDIIFDPSQKDLFNIFDNETVKYYNYSTDGVFEEKAIKDLEDDQKVYINLNDLTNIDAESNIVSKNYYNINTLYAVQDLDFANILLTLSEEKYSINLTADEILNCSVIDDLRNNVDWYQEFLSDPVISIKIKDHEDRFIPANLDKRDRTDSKITILFDNIPSNINKLLGLNIVDKVYHGSVSKGYRYVFNAGKGKFIYVADVLEEVYFINTSLGDISKSEPSQTWKLIYTYKIADIDVTIKETPIRSLDVTHLSQSVVDTKLSHNPITYPTLERIINDLTDIIGNKPSEEIQGSISNELYNLSIRVLAHNIKQHCEAIQRNTIHSLPSIFDRQQHGLELFEILPIYKGNLLYKSFIDGTISNEQLLEMDLWYSDDSNKFNPKQLKSVDAIDITNNKLSTNYGVMFCKKKHFVNLTWYEDQNLLPSIMKDFCDNDNLTPQYRYSDVTKDGTETNELYNAVVIVYNDIRNRIVNSFTSRQFNEYLYHPSLIVDNKEVAANVVTRKQKHFDTSIESIEYGNINSDIDDNVLYVHPFNIYNVSRTIDNMLVEEQISKLPDTAYKRITVDDIVTKTHNSDGTITYSFHNTYNALYHIAFTTTSESLTFDNLTTANSSWKCSPKIIYRNGTSEVKGNYQSDNLTIEQYIICINKNLQRDDNYHNNYINNVEDFERLLVDSNIINRINDLIDEQNGIVKNYCFTEFSVTPLKAVLNDINTINLIMSFNNTPFMDIPTVENGVINLEKLHTIEQKFYKQYKAIDILGNIYYKYVLITTNEELTIKYDDSIGMFYTIKREEITNAAGTLETVETKDIFNIVLETEFIKLNKNLWERYMNVNSQNSDDVKEFRDMYVFRPLTEMEYDDKFSNSGIYIVDNTTNTTNTQITSDTGILYPCFKSVYYEKSKETIIYKNWVSSNIVETKLLNINTLEEIDTFYRYNVDNASLFVEITKKDLSTLLELKLYPNADKLIKTYVKKFNSNNIRQDNTIESADTNLLKYNLKTIDVGNTRYGYYIVTVDLNNSRDMFNIRGIVDNDTLNLSSVDFMPKLKYITYINGVDITKSPTYLQSIFRQLCPFLNIDLLGEATKLETMVIPKAFTLTDVYETVKVSSNDSIKERNLVFVKQNIGATKTSVLQRYTNSIVPFIYKTNTIDNVYDYKYKDVQTQILPSGNYYSIGDFTIKSSRSTIDLPVPLSIYHSYQGEPDTYYPVEYKYFNKSKMVNLETEFKVPVTRNLTYNELLQYESDTKTLEVFASHINKKKVYSGDELLFLYKKYKVSFDSTSVKLKLDKSEKLYKLTYIFTLL